MSKVLLVDDEPDFLIIMEKVLKKHGYDVLESANGKSGLKKARENLPDLILLDIMMTDISGWEVARRLKKDPKTKDIPIIMLTVVAEESGIQRSFEYAGAEWHITKPFDTDVFFSILDMAALKSTELEKKIEEAIERDKKMKQVFDMINPKLLDYKYDFLNRK